MVTVLAGQYLIFKTSPENIVRYSVRAEMEFRSRWSIPAKNEITFSLFGWSGRKSYQVSVEPSKAPFVQRLSIGQDTYLKYNDPIIIHTWIIKNRDEVPPQMHHITQR